MKSYSSTKVYINSKKNKCKNIATEKYNHFEYSAVAMWISFKT